METYPITWHGETVGEALLKRQGMFWVIQCRCAAHIQEPLRMIAISGDQRIDLGICVNYHEGCGLQGRIPVKNIISNCLSFHLEAVNSERFVPVFEEEPFSLLHRLDAAHFGIHNGHAGLWFMIKD